VRWTIAATSRDDSHLRGLLYEAATVLLTRTRPRNESSLRSWGLKLREGLGFKRAAVAVARKLAVIVHSMLKTGEVFNASTGATA
jgi:transposase